MSNYKFFISDLAPNGTCSLTVVNNEDEVIDCIDEALFGTPYSLVNVTPDGYIDGDELIAFKPETEDELDWLYEQQFVFDVTIYNLTPYIAVSPVSNGNDVQKFIQKYRK